MRQEKLYCLIHGAGAPGAGARGGTPGGGTGGRAGCPSRPGRRRGRGSSAAGPHRGRRARLHCSPGSDKDHGGRHRPPGRVQPGHGLSGVPRGQGRHRGGRGRHRDRPVLQRGGRPDGSGPGPRGGPRRRHGGGRPAADRPRGVGVPAGPRTRADPAPPHLQPHGRATAEGIVVRRPLPGPMAATRGGSACRRVGDQDSPVVPGVPGRGRRSDRRDVHGSPGADLRAAGHRQPARPGRGSGAAGAAGCGRVARPGGLPPRPAVDRRAGDRRASKQHTVSRTTEPIERRTVERRHVMTDQMRDNAAIIGRDEINDLEAILSVVNTDWDEAMHSVHSVYDTIFTWDYEKGQRPKLDKLYEKAKKAQWNAQTDLPWETEVDQEQLVVANAVANGGFNQGIDVSGTPLERWGDREWIQFGIESQNWTLSQFMHGEQGALVCTAKIVESVPWIDAKYYAATQVMDEARHVEVFSKYLDDKLSGHYPINAHLRLLLDDIIADSRWDMTYLGMQIMVEGLALAAFGFMHQMTTEPLLKQLLRYVMSDESRHVAFGVLSLQEYYGQLSAAELRERQEFAFEAAVRMRDRFLQQEVWERMGVNAKVVAPLMLQVPERQVFQTMLFSKIVPNCKKLGLLDAADGWLRQRFTELGVIAFEDWADTGEEYDSLQATPGEPVEAQAS